jgi:hypothetical protein
MLPPRVLIFALDPFEFGFRCAHHAEQVPPFSPAEPSKTAQAMGFSHSRIRDRVVMATMWAGMPVCDWSRAGEKLQGWPSLAI